MCKSNKELAVEVALKCLELAYDSKSSIETSAMSELAIEIIENTYSKLEQLGKESK